MKKNNQIEKVKSDLNPVLLEVQKILGLDTGKLLIEQEKKGVQATIEKLCKENRGNKDLALLRIRDNSVNFYNISSHLQKDKDILHEMIVSLEKEGNDFLVIFNFIDTRVSIDKNTKDALLKFYENRLQMSQNIISKDFINEFLELKKNDITLYEIFISQKVIIGKGPKVSINPDFVQKVIVSLGKIENYSGLSIGDKKTIKFETILNILGLSLTQVSSKNEFIFETIISLIDIEENKKAVKDTSVEVNDKKEETQQKDDIIKNDAKDDESKKSSIEEKLDYCIPSSNYSYSGGSCNIFIGNSYLKISDTEMEEFSTKALTNFIVFYKMLYELGLQFLWDKYQLSFSTYVNNKIGFDYKRGEGVTESKSLGILNIIGKNIGIPEVDVLITGKDGKTQTEVKCFKTLGDAKLKFKEIKETGKIKGETYSDLGMNSFGAVESYLIEKGKIDSKKGILNITNW